MIRYYKLLFKALVIFYSGFLFGQTPVIPNIPSLPQPASTQLPNYGNRNFTPATEKKGQVIMPSNQFVDIDRQRQQQQYEQITREVEQNEKQRIETLNQIKNDINEVNNSISYDLPSISNVKGTEFYREVYDKMLLLNIESYSVKDVNFDIENAYFENQLDKEEFDKIIKQSAAFLTKKMKELNYDASDNSAKNFMLFQFFSETLQLKATKQEHLPFGYDFEDYMGLENHSRLFVSKLIETGSGQCHSLPMLYLILAEEIGAEAYLALSPNHSYIRFPDDKGKWYNVELTNGMFSTESYILQSGYIKSEALQHKIYMENLSRKELLGQHLTDLAGGYIHKFGYDEFAQTIIERALILYPNSITANMLQANIDTARFEFVMGQLGINPRNPNELQKIGHFPRAVELLNKVNSQYDFIDDLGYEHMPEEAYQKWLQAMQGEKQKQDNEVISKQLKGILTKPSKTLKN